MMNCYIFNVSKNIMYDNFNVMNLCVWSEIEKIFVVDLSVERKIDFGLF